MPNKTKKQKKNNTKRTPKKNKYILSGGVNIEQLLNLEEDRLYEFVDKFTNNITYSKERQQIAFSFQNQCVDLKSEESKNLCDLFFINIFMFLKKTLNKDEFKEHKKYFIINDDNKLITITNINILLKMLFADYKTKYEYNQLFLKNNNLKKIAEINFNETNNNDKNMKNIIKYFNNLKLNTKIPNNIIIFYRFVKLLTNKLNNDKNNNYMLDGGGFVLMGLGIAFIVILLLAGCSL